MTESIRILKEAMLLELRGRAFYAQCAEQAADGGVSSFFRSMADEEETHARILKEQLERLQAGDGVSMPDSGPVDTLFNVADTVLSPETVGRIDPAGFEASAVSAAIDMEIRSIELYGGRADHADGPEEKQLYAWLKNWEEGHLEMLRRIDEDLRERFWQDNDFWPFG